MRLIQRTLTVVFGVHAALFALNLHASELSDSELADKALASIGAPVPQSTNKCSACHQMDATHLRAWFTTTAALNKDCLSLAAKDALVCLSRNGAEPFAWGAKKLGLFAARVDSDAIVNIFKQAYGAKYQREFNKFRQRAYMPRSGAPGFADDEWANILEYAERGAPGLEQKLGE